jgi:hypothetical protein
VGTESHSGYHLFERMEVAAADFVGRNERMWYRIGSGKELILSSVGIDLDISISNSNPNPNQCWVRVAFETKGLGAMDVWKVWNILIPLVLYIWKILFTFVVKYLDNIIVKYINFIMNLTSQLIYIYGIREDRISLVQFQMHGVKIHLTFFFLLFLSPT